MLKDELEKEGFKVSEEFLEKHNIKSVNTFKFILYFQKTDVGDYYFSDEIIKNLKDIKLKKEDLESFKNIEEIQDIRDVELYYDVLIFKDQDNKLRCCELYETDDIEVFGMIKYHQHCNIAKKDLIEWINEYFQFKRESDNEDAT